MTQEQAGSDSNRNPPLSVDSEARSAFAQTTRKADQKFADMKCMIVLHANEWENSHLENYKFDN